MSSSTTPGRYVPPHLRKQESSAPIAGPSRISQPPFREKREWSSAPASNSRTPWSSTSTPRDDPSTSALRPFPMAYEQPGSVQQSSSSGWNRATQSAPTPRFNHNRNGSASISPTLHVFGDSFTGPLKLLSDENAKVTTFKGSSAKGLNNPNSIKQVSRDLLPALNGLLAPPPYAYTPSTGRWALLIFGNVDLQINYLWQLQTKPISHLSFPTPTTSAKDDVSMDTDDGSSGLESSNVLATATETSVRGPALGPELFVETVIRAYTSWLEREIVNGPIGERIRDRTQKSVTPGVRKPPPGKILIASALPPLVEDEVLPRIPEKYVERLEEDHAKAHKAMQSGMNETERTSRTPWAKQKEEVVEEGLSTISRTDELRPASPPSSASSNWSSGLESQRSNNTELTVPSSPSKAPPSPRTKASIQELLKHDPPLCTLPIRIQMTNHYNSLLSAFCAKHPDILSFIDITPSILSGNSSEVLASGSVPDAADRNTWACPVDPTNIHPLWEPTLPLWLEEFKKEGLPVDNYKISADAEETFKAYEVDKRRRFENGPHGGGEEARIKLRDE